MRVVVTTEAHFGLDPSGTFRSDTGGRAYEFWTNYLLAFDEVLVVARVSAQTHHEGFRVEGPGVTVFPLPGYQGWRGSARSYPTVRRALSSIATSQEDSYIVRLPSLIGSTLTGCLRRRRIPYAAEVVGDPYDVFSSGVAHPVVDRVLRTFFTCSLRRTVRRSDAISYVTSHTLQRRYPARTDATTTNYSSVQLPSAAFISSPRKVNPDGRVVVAVGTQSQMYKGHDLLIAAAAELRRRGEPIRVQLVGDGRCQGQLREQAKRLGIADAVDFLGQLPAGPRIRDVLDSADLFVMPSRTEGLPRALIEAMARGMPALGTRVGAIPELLEPPELIDPGSASALADAISVLLRDERRREDLSHANLKRSRDYADEVLRERRRQFYGTVVRQAVR